MITTSLYGLVGGAGMLADQLFPLWVLTPESSGGFAMRETQIGLILGELTLMCCCSELMWQLLVVHSN